ncbi:flavodoxin domain-containing protein [Bacillus sp. Bva_UNVM-123]|uniref:flavodoxin family protein n=1 Tax=Bacillus sp. Bva_UNVM-123 TaxID=2829798 RepID=UPI00391F0415
MTSKAAYYFSMTGNTKSILEQLENINEWDVYDLNEMNPEDVDFKDYKTILIGTLTLGRGTPPIYFKKIFKQLVELKNRKIGLFGSGQSHYGDDFFCGALDVLEDLLRQKNEIAFKLKFESYPTPPVIEEFKSLVRGMN